MDNTHFETLENNKPRFNHLSTFMLHSSSNKSSTEIEIGKRVKRRGSELLEMSQINDSNQESMKNNTEILGKVQILDFSCEETEKQKEFRIKKTESNRQLMFTGIAIALATFSALLVIHLAEYL